MADPAPSSLSEPIIDPRPLVISACGTFLKPEMKSIYRQVVGLTRVRTIVYAQHVENRSSFPFPAVTHLTKLHHRTKGNFLLRFWFKYVIRQWPPPIRINKYVGPCHPYDMPEKLREDAPDLVHVYYGHKAVRFFGMLQDWGGPWIVSFHGVDAAKFLDQPGYHDQLQKVFQTAILVLGRSQSLLTRLQSLGCPPEKLRLNRTPIPLDHLPIAPRQTPTDGAWRLLQACRLIPKKGILTTLHAIKLVLPQFPNLRYVLCGDGPQADEIRQVADKLGLTDHLEWLGWTKSEALLDQYQRAHLFLHASEMTADGDQEGIPNSMLEAMATGLPVVATHHGGIPEAVTDGRDGLLVPERDPEALATALTRLMSNEPLWRQMGQTAAQSVRDAFGSETQITRLEDCYLEAIEIAKASQPPAS